MDESKMFDQIHDVDLKKTMEQYYIDYSMSVISARALPDVRDGLKPVQRRILFSMIELNNGPDKPHRKCARIVGDTMGKYHPHGDSSIYEALVKLAQDFATRYPLVDGHGNFGSIDGDGAAAMRYTEARLSKISMEMLADINKDTVNFIPNFDETEQEPTVLPARYPNLLVNGTSGIAVGMATNIPPHNLAETIDGVVKIIDNEVEGNETTIDDILDVIQGPDFPTGATIVGRKSIEEAYRTGRAKLKVRAVSNIETMENGKSRIVVTEIPYMVNKAKLIENIAELVKDKRVDGITDLRDESNREGMRIVIELRKDVNANIILNQLLKHTQLQDTFGVIMLSLVNGEPKVLNILDMLKYYLDHQKDVVTRRTRYELNKAEKRAHILEGLLIALEHIDEVIRIMKESQTVQIARTALMETFALSEEQAREITEMRLRQLTGLAREDLENEYKELKAQIDYYKAILADEKKLLSVIREEILAVKDKYKDERRTKIIADEDEMCDEDLIPNVRTVVALTKNGYIKRMSVDNFKEQNRGGKGIRAMHTIEDDYMKEILMTKTHHHMMFFTNFGRVYKLKAYEIPESGRTSRGIAIINLLQLNPGEKVTSIVTREAFSGEEYLVMVTKKGMIKRTPIIAYKNILKSGIIAISLKEEDELIGVKITDGDNDIVMVTKNGHGIRIKEDSIRTTGRSAMGVYAMSLSEGDEIIGMQLDNQGESMLLITEKGLGKRTSLDEIRVQHRNGKGLMVYKITEKTGSIVGFKMVNDDHQVMLITNEGIIIRIAVKDIAKIGRITQGVKLMNIRPESGVRIASVAKVKLDSDSFEDCEITEEEIGEKSDNESQGNES